MYCNYQTMRGHILSFPRAQVQRVSEFLQLSVYGIDPLAACCESTRWTLISNASKCKRSSARKSRPLFPLFLLMTSQVRDDPTIRLPSILQSLRLARLECTMRFGIAPRTDVDAEQVFGHTVCVHSRYMYRWQTPLRSEETNSDESLTTSTRPAGSCALPTCLVSMPPSRGK